MKKLFTVERVYVLVAACIAIVLLFTGTFIGVADNGDFLRIMGSIGLNFYDALEPYEDRFFNYSHSLFAYDSFFRGFYPTTQLILVVLARSVALLFNSSAFDIRFLAVFYVAFLLIAGYLLIKYNKTKSWITAVTLAILMVVVFADVGYLIYFNSLFGEPVSFVFLLLTIALGLLLTKQEKPSKRIVVLFFASALFLVCSKTQNAPIGVGFALLGIRYIWLNNKDKVWRTLTTTLCAITFVASVVMYVGAPKDFKNINMYQTVFFGILNGSPDVDGDLQKLGLPSKLSVLAGTNYFQSDTAIKQDDPALKHDFYDRISHVDVLLYYIQNPARFISRMEVAAENGMTIRPYYLGNYEKTEGKPAGANTFAFSTWSEFKKHNIPNKLWFIVLIFVLFFAAAIYEWLRNKTARSRISVELFILLGLIGIFSFLIPIVGDGLADLSKHLFLFNVVFDMMLVTSVVWVVYQLTHQISQRISLRR